MEAIGKSKYIFTGKVLNVKKSKPTEGARGKRSNVYRVYMRRVLKGSVSELKSFVKFEAGLDTLSGATVVVERPRARESCAPAPRPRLSAIFLSDGVFTDVPRLIPRLRLLTDPVPLTLYHLDRVNAAVTGKLYSKSRELSSTKQTLITRSIENYKKLKRSKLSQSVYPC